MFVPLQICGDSPSFRSSGLSVGNVTIQWIVYPGDPVRSLEAVCGDGKRRHSKQEPRIPALPLSVTSWDDLGCNLTL